MFPMTVGIVICLYVLTRMLELVLTRKEPRRTSVILRIAGAVTLLAAALVLSDLLGGVWSDRFNFESRAQPTTILVPPGR